MGLLKSLRLDKDGCMPFAVTVGGQLTEAVGYLKRV